jgi:dUTP pyrophosphatase
MPVVPLLISRIDDSVPLPAYKTKGAAGLDLCARERKEIWPSVSLRVPTGLRLEIPRGHLGFVTPRSGLAYDHGITVLNTPGTIDSDYRGELHVILLNTGQKTYYVDKGERIAQLIILRRPEVELFIVGEDELSETDRGEGGFGSTGRS